MKAELIDRMGSDIRVANAARVSFDKETDWEYKQNGQIIQKEWWGGYNSTKDVSEGDQRIINFLAREGHWTPFSHVMITMRETVPIFVARQRFKHMVGFTYNEVSRRYVDTPPEFYIPEVWRGKPVNAKQGSSEEVIMDDKLAGFREYCEEAAGYYQDMIDSGVAPEMARMILPQATYTSYYVTGSLAAWARAYKLRIDPHAQKEIQDLAHQWGDIIGGIKELEYSWKALTSN